MVAADIEGAHVMAHVGEGNQEVVLQAGRRVAKRRGRDTDDPGFGRMPYARSPAEYAAATCITCE